MTTKSIRGHAPNATCNMQHATASTIYFLHVDYKSPYHNQSQTFTKN